MHNHGPKSSHWSYPYPTGSTTSYAESTLAHGDAENAGFRQPRNEQYGQSSDNEPQFFSASHDAIEYEKSHSRSDADLAVPETANTE